MATTVVNIKSGATYDQYIGRAGHGHDGYFGNPFKLQPGESRGATLSNYKKWFDHRIANDPKFKERILSLKGKILGCFCHPNLCHGDIIAQYLDTQP